MNKYEIELIERGVVNQFFKISQIPLETLKYVATQNQQKMLKEEGAATYQTQVFLARLSKSVAVYTRQDTANEAADIAAEYSEEAAAKIRALAERF